MSGGAPTFFFVRLAMTVIASAQGYNLDTRSPIQAIGPAGSYFGFSVTLHQEGDENMMIVGAPLEDVGIDGASNTGAVYRCPVIPPFDTDAHCRRIELDMEAGKNVNKSDQWLGATVRSSGVDGKVLSCAPFYRKHYLGSRNSIYGRELTGRCVISRENFTKSSEHVVCPPPTEYVERYNGYLKGSQCSAGLAGDFDEEGNMILGAPGSRKHRGRLYVQETEASYRQTKFKRGSHFIGNILGYSVTQGHFLATSEINYVAGAPRAYGMKGGVYIYNSRLDTELHSISGKQMGSYFGHGVIAGDFNGDGLDDLVVSAPSYWNREQGQANAGQICIFYQTAEHQLSHDTSTVITGKVSNGRFGFAITSLGDVNDDSIYDLAVGAPYDEDGAIFIYHGKRSKIDTVEAQVLRPESFDVIGFSHFGYSLSGGRDADDNEYPDLLVGDYSADKVLLIRTRPVIRPLFELTFNPKDVDFSDDPLRVDDRNYHGFNLTACMWYKGKGTPASYSFSVRLNLDTEKQTPRAVFNLSRESSIEFESEPITKDRSWCGTMLALIEKESVDDIINPIIVKIQVDPILNEELPPGEIHPVVDPYSRTAQNQIRIIAGCVTRNCNPELALSVESDKSLLYMGNTTKVTLTVNVSNHGDDAFQAMLHTRVHRSWVLAAYQPIQSELSIFCRQGGTDVQCDIGNPLPRRPTTLTFNMTFNILSVPGDVTELSVNLLANSTNAEEDSNADNRVTLKFELRPKITVAVNGSTNLARFVFNRTTIDELITTDHDAGEEIIHTYRVHNRGPGTIKHATLEVRWPMFTDRRDEYLLYLTQVTLNQEDECEVSGEGVNPRNLTITVDDTDEDSDDVDDKETETSSLRKRRMDDDHSSNQSQPEKRPEPMAQTQLAQIQVANCTGEYGGCVKITCQLQDIQKGTDDIFLKIRSRLWSETMEKSDAFSWEVVSHASLIVHELPYVVQPTEGLEANAMLTLTVIPEVLKENHHAPLWAIILAIFIALLLLVLIVLVLWKLGFFKRKKFKEDGGATSAVQETQQVEEIE